MADSASLRVAGSTTPALSLGLIDGFSLRSSGQPVALPQGEQRLVAYLAIRRKPLSATHLAATLWTDLPPKQGSACLRSTTHRIRRRVPGLIERRGGRLLLLQEVEIDIESMDLAIAGFLHPSGGHPDVSVPLQAFTGDLLPGWFEDWVFVERERLRQRVMHALDRVAALALEEGRIAGSIDAALTSVSMEPLRETPRRVLVAAHLAEGNVSEAIREYDAYAALLEDQLGIAPTGEFSGLVAPWMTRRS